jgi:hypothetical protein
MTLKDFLKKVSLSKNEVSFYYKNITDDVHAEVEIINSTSKGQCEIIRLSQINGRTNYAGFFVPIRTIWVKTPHSFEQIGTLIDDMKKVSNIVLLPTKKAKEGLIGKHEADGSYQILSRKALGNKYFDTDDGSPAHGIVIAHHTYVLSNDKNINDGDWCIAIYDKNEKFLFKASEELLKLNEKYGAVNKKIIATDNESLTISVKNIITPEGVNVSIHDRILPRPSNEFLKKFCELGGIDEVLVEYDIKSTIPFSPDAPKRDRGYIEFPKVAPDNTINPIL